MVLLSTGVEAATRMAMHLNEDLLQPYEIDSNSIRMTASVGVADYPQSGATTEELLHSADASMYRAKAAGGRRVAVAPARSAWPSDGGPGFAGGWLPLRPGPEPPTEVDPLDLTTEGDRAITVRGAGCGDLRMRSRSVRAA